MNTFRDNEAREWVVKIHVAAVKQCRALVNIDLHTLVGEDYHGLGALLADPVKLVDVLYVLCKTEADARNISEEDFGRAMGGDSIEAGTTAFLGALVDYQTHPRIRAQLLEVIKQSTALRDRMFGDIEKKMETLDIDAIADKILAGRTG